MRLLITGLVAFTSVLTSAFADDFGPYPAYYTQECGRCHIAYPPQLLTVSGWRTQISGLNDHYGIDARVAVPASRTILSYLVNNAAWQDEFAPANPAARLTSTKWFVRTHGLNVSKDKAISDCASCHSDASIGKYNQAAQK
jgi:mono/diheme cytochrome c family protein